MDSILFIDDDPLMCRIVGDKLKERQLFTGRTLADCQKVLAAGHHPSWIICDYFLEGGETALDVLDLVEKYHLDDTRVICITANSTLREIEACKSKFAAVIEKATPQFFEFIDNLR